jgi:hypothetical protein
MFIGDQGMNHKDSTGKRKEIGKFGDSDQFRNTKLVTVPEFPYFFALTRAVFVVHAVSIAQNI